MFDRWIASQRIGFLAYCFSLPRTRGAAEGEFAAIRERLAHTGELLATELNTAQASYPNFISNLPPICLQLLLNIPPGRLLRSIRELRTGWKSLQDELLGKETENEISIVNGARIVGYHMLRGSTKSVSLVRLAKSVFSNSWRRYEDTADGAEAYISSLRDAWSNTEQKIQAINAIDEQFLDAPYWSHIENVLYHHVFCWPLLVFRGTTTERAAISLPVGIDVEFNGRYEMGRYGSGVTILGDGSVDASRWHQSMKRATDAAKKLWRGKHGNFGNFRDEVMGASIVFDFTVADQIVKGLPYLVSLQDRSMEAYFSQAILSRFLGSPASAFSAVTGLIGRERTPENPMDFDFEWPEQIGEKLHYVFDTRFFERIVVPRMADLPTEDPRRTAVINCLTRQSAEINQAKALQHVADAVQTTGWRQHRYIRCPDMAYIVHGEDHRNVPTLDDERVQSCLRLLRKNDRVLLELPDELSARDLAGALWHINTTLRNRIQLQRPPMMSWTFVRAVLDELDGRFWYVIWRSMGATARDFNMFYQSPTPEVAAEQLANVMNRFSPGYYSPAHRTPDILIILGSDRLAHHIDEAKNPLLRPLAFHPIVREVLAQARLSPCHMDGFVGGTRLILVKNDYVSKDVQPTAQANAFDQPILERLSLFRFGFTQQMASIVLTDLGVRGSRVRETLTKLVNKGFLRYATEGEYHIPGRVGRDLEDADYRPDDSVPPELGARRHYCVGMALAPYLSQSDVPGLSLDRAFRPEFVHEAEYHLTRALKYSERCAREDPKNSIRTALQRLQRFADHQGWHTVVRLTKSKNTSKDAYELGEELLEARVDSGYPAHSGHFVNIANAVEQRWKELKQNPNYKDHAKVQALRGKIVELFEQAEAACEDFKSERDYNRLIVLTRYATFLEKHGTTPDEADKAKRLTTEAVQLLKGGIDGTGAMGEWYELVGDGLEDHGKAAEIYGLGLKWVDWNQLWVKLFGAAALVPDPSLIKERADELTPNAVARILYKVRPQKKRLSREKRSWVKERWDAGIEQLDQRFGDNREVREQVRFHKSTLNQRAGI